MGTNTSSIDSKQDNSHDDNTQKGSQKMQANPSTTKADSYYPTLLEVELHWLEAHWKT